MEQNPLIKKTSQVEQGVPPSKIEQHLTKVYRSGPVKESMFYVSPDREYVEKSYTNKSDRQEIQEFEIDLGNILDLTDIKYQKSTIVEVIKALKSKGVVFTAEEENSLKSFFKSNQSTFFNTKYKEMPLWQFINFTDEIANASKRSGFDSIKQFETASFALGPEGSDWDWSNKTTSYFILKNITHPPKSANI